MVSKEEPIIPKQILSRVHTINKTIRKNVTQAQTKPHTEWSKGNEVGKGYLVILPSVKLYGKYYSNKGSNA
jgi:hypothetical protein